MGNAETAKLEHVILQLILDIINFTNITNSMMLNAACASISSEMNVGNEVSFAPENLSKSEN